MGDSYFEKNFLGASVQIGEIDQARSLFTGSAALAEVVEGQLLVVLEAMKMEHRITAPGAATVAEVRVRAGDQVTDGELLVSFEHHG